MTTVFQRVGHYEILEEIGRGGMAAVFLAHDTRANRKVALKLVPQGTDREHREILDAERWGVQLQARLSAICGLVPEVYEEGDLAPYYFIAMEYVDGENLSDVISRGPMPVTQAAAIGIQLCQFLESAHQFETVIDGRSFRSLVHGDLKPRNVRLAPGGIVKVLDFGIAKALSLSRRVTRNDFGSMPYLSPERLDSVEVDAYADLWALGVILYEMLSGQAPFHARDTRRLEQEIRSGYARHPLNGGCPPALQAITAKLLAPTIDDRYPGAGEIREELERVQAGHATAAERAGWPGRADEAATRRTRRPNEDVSDEATRRTRPPSPIEAVATARTVATPVAPPSSAPVTAPPTVTPSVRPAPAGVLSRAMRARSPLRTILMLTVLVLVLNEVSVGWAADRLAADAVTRDLDGLSTVWPEYESLSRRSFLRLGLIGLQRTLRRRAETLSDQVIANYRASTFVRERQWDAARANLLQATALVPGDRRLKAALRYCDGHLYRINGEALRRRGQAATASQQFTEAVTAFREAAELRSSWPDPFLGLARTYIYGLDDIDQAADALKRAQQLGYASGDRETAQLVDGYRTRGDSLVKTSQALRDLPQEQEYLRRALAAYREAWSLCERIPRYPGIASHLRRMRIAMDQTEARIAELTAISGGG
jgi:serine/threonine protein kinase/tetratricopeptide (TPR) repeat protein